MVAEIDGTIAAIRAEGAPLTGMLRIAVPYTYGRKVIAPRLAAFMAAHPALRTNEPEVLVRAVLAGAGIAIVSQSMTSAMFADGRQGPVLPAWTPPPREVNALYAPGRASVPKVRAFLDFLVDALRTEPPVLSL